MTFTRRQTLIGAAATVAAAALPASKLVEIASGEAVLKPARGVLLAGSRELVDAVARIGDWYWDFGSRDVLHLTENGWMFLFNLADGARAPQMPTTAVEHHGWEVADEIETAMQEFDFLARIETSESPS
jgi:hypothetical protein